MYTNITQLQGNSDIIIDKWTTADSNSMQWTKNFKYSQPATRFPSTDLNKLQTVFDEDTIFCKNCNLRFLISSPTVCKQK